jgi:hypothetical protein
MKEVFGKMNKLILSVLFLIGILSADDEIYIDQNGSNASIDLEQLGSSNLIGGASSVAGTVTALDLDGASMTLDINQIGSSNIFRSDAIDGESFTGFFEFTGDSNVFDMLMNSTGLITSDFVNMNIQVTGSSNEFDVEIGEDDSASYLDLDWTILGDSNEFDFDIDYSNAINFVDINGSSNSITANLDGYSGTSSSDSGYLYLDIDGSSNTYNITQSSTLARDYLKIIQNGSNSNICIIQSDSGGSTSC